MGAAGARDGLSADEAAVADWVAQREYFTADDLAESFDSFDTDRLSLDDIEASMDRYVASLEAGRAADEGWPDWINVPSKIGQVATARIAARDMGEIQAR